MDKPIAGNKRINWIDMAKGYGILLVILEHLDVGTLGTWINSFHVPLFFFLSGYVFSVKQDFGQLLRKKCKTIIVPYFCLGAVMLIFELYMICYVWNSSINEFYDIAIRFLIQRRVYTLWFLACLFFLNIIFYPMVKILKSDMKIVISAVVMTVLGMAYYKLGGEALPWNIDICFSAYPFFAAGYLYKINSESYEKSEKYLWMCKYSVIIMLSINIISIYLTLKMSGNGLNMFDCSYGIIPFTYLAAFAGIGIIINISKWKTIKCIQYIGANSLLYFAWHQTIMIPITDKIYSMLHLKSIMEYGIIGISLYKAMELLAIVLMVSILNIIISNSKLRFMVGKYN